MQDYELDAYLGDVEVTDEQRAAILAAADAIEVRWPDPDAEDDRREALAAAVQVVLGDASLEEVAAAWHRARAAEREARAALTGALIASEGSEVSLAERAGTTRMTVRKALGK